VLSDWSGASVSLPPGGFYLWVNAPADDGWAFTRAIAEAAGALVSPGDFYGAPDHVRIALVQPDDRIELVAQRLSR
jgi:aspartate/methionine/tyrosine aminotransferase